MDYTAILIAQVALFIFMLTVISIHNHHLIKSADKRLDRANEMVNRLSHSCDTLANTNSEIKDLALGVKRDYQQNIEEIKKLHQIQVKEISTNRDDYKKAYNSLLARYNSIDDRMISGYEKMQTENCHTIRDLASKPTISNSNNTDMVPQA